MMREVLGVKSTRQLGLNIFASILLTIVVIFMIFLGKNNMSPEVLFTTVFMAVIDLILIISVFIQADKPSTMISCDASNLYLHYTNRVKVIPLNEIRQAIPRQAQSRGFRYSFGQVLIYTKFGDFKLSVISDVERVCIDIMDRVRKVIEDQ